MYLDVLLSKSCGCPASSNVPAVTAGEQDGALEFLYKNIGTTNKYYVVSCMMPYKLCYRCVVSGLYTL